MSLMGCIFDLSTHGKRKLKRGADIRLSILGFINSHPALFEEAIDDTSE